MTSPEPDPKPGTTVAKLEDPEEAKHPLLELAQTPEERAFAFNTMTAVRQGRLIRKAAEAISATSWGKDISPLARAAVARYAFETGTDPVRHWLVLGGNLYDRAELWLDLVTTQSTYEGNTVEHINDDERLDKEERDRRRQLRAKHNMPDDVKGCAIVTIFKRMPGGEVRPFQGVNHAGNRQGFNARKGAEGLIKDPIGEQDPAKTAETRAFRRAAKRAWPIWPFKRELPDNEGLSIEALGREKVNDMLDTERQEMAKAQGLLDGKKEFFEMAPGLQMRTNEGDRLPGNRIYTSAEPEHDKGVQKIDGIEPSKVGDQYELDQSEQTEIET